MYTQDLFPFPRGGRQGFCSLQNTKGHRLHSVFRTQDFARYQREDALTGGWEAQGGTGGQSLTSVFLSPSMNSLAAPNYRGTPLLHAM